MSPNVRMHQADDGHFVFTRAAQRGNGRQHRGSPAQEVSSRFHEFECNRTSMPSVERVLAMASPPIPMGRSERKNRIAVTLAVIANTLGNFFVEPWNAPHGV